MTLGELLGQDLKGGSQIQHSIWEEFENDTWPQSEFLENDPESQLIRIQLGKTDRDASQKRIRISNQETVRE